VRGAESCEHASTRCRCPSPMHSRPLALQEENQLRRLALERPLLPIGPDVLRRHLLRLASACHRPHSHKSDRAPGIQLRANAHERKRSTTTQRKSGVSSEYLRISDAQPCLRSYTYRYEHTRSYTDTDTHAPTGSADLAHLILFQGCPDWVDSPVFESSLSTVPKNS
jgi:hypothetical protein